MARTKGKEYQEGELELILSLAPTLENIKRLSSVLGRSESAVKLVYRSAFGYGSFPEGEAFNRKVHLAKERLGIELGRKTPRPKPIKA